MKLVEIVVGINRFVVMQKVEEIVKGFKTDFERYDFSTKHPDFNFSNVIEAVLTISLFDKPRLVFLNIEEEKDMKFIDEASLIEILEHPGDVKVVIAMKKRIPQTQKLGKVIKKYANQHIIVQKDAFNTERYLSRALFDMKLQMTPEAKTVFLEKIDEDYARMDSELEKLSLLNKEITASDVKAMITQDISRDVFALSNALVAKNHQKAFRIYHSLLVQKNDPLNLGPMVASSLRGVYQVQTLYHLGYTQTQIASKLSMSDRQVWMIMNNQMGKVKQVLALLNTLSTIDQKAKLGEIDRFVAFEMFMLEMMQ